MNNVLDTRGFPIAAMLRVEGSRIVSLDIFGPPREGAHTEHVVKRLIAITAEELSAVGVTEDYPVNVWLAPDDQEFIPGQG